MKRLKICAFTVLASIIAPFALSSVSAPQSINIKNSDTPIATGTFIQPWLYVNWSDDMWDKEFQLWNDMGIEYAIMGDTALVYIDDNYRIAADYPSKIDGASTGRDYLTKLFQKCKEYNIKLFVGVGNSASANGVDWSFMQLTNPKNVEKVRNLGEAFGTVAEDIYNVYYDEYKDVFAGFYFVPELYNSNYFDDESTRSAYVNGLAEGMNKIFEKIDSLEGNLPLALSPYVNIFGGSWVTKNPENHSKFWQELFETANFRDGDILVPQDSVGAGGMDLKNLETWTKAYKDAVDNCGKDIKLWSNCEIFASPPAEYFGLGDGIDYTSSASIDRMIQQFSIVSKYVDRIVTFAFPHYLSPYNAAPGYFNTYKNYLETGELEKNSPTPPNKFRTIVTKVSYKDKSSGKTVEKDALTIYWSGMYDDYGVHRVNIYKNGDLFTFRVAVRNDGRNPHIIYPNNFYDAEFDLENDSATYEFEVIDCAGNVSERSKFTVEKGSVPNNEKLDSPYSGPIESEPTTSEGTTASETEASLTDSAESVDAPSNTKTKTLGIALAAVAATLVAGFGIFKVIKTKSKRNSDTKE